MERLLTTSNLSTSSVVAWSKVAVCVSMCAVQCRHTSRAAWSCCFMTQKLAGQKSNRSSHGPGLLPATLTCWRYAQKHAMRFASRFMVLLGQMAFHGVKGWKVRGVWGVCVCVCVCVCVPPSAATSESSSITLQITQLTTTTGILDMLQHKCHVFCQIYLSV